MDVSEIFVCAMVLVLTWIFGLELDDDDDNNDNAEPCLMEVSFVIMYFFILFVFNY